MPRSSQSQPKPSVGPGKASPAGTIRPLMRAMPCARSESAISRSDAIAGRFEEDVIAKTPAVVVLIAGVNDVYQGRPAQHVKDQLAALYKRAHAAGIRVVAGTIIPYNTATADQNARMRDINDWIRVQGRADPGVVYVDTRAAVAAPDDPDKLASSPDGLHPDAAGYRKMADAIRPAVEQALRSGKR